MTHSAKRNAECPECLEIMPLLMPVYLVTPLGRHVSWHCTPCRMEWDNREMFRAHVQRESVTTRRPA